MTTVAPPAIRLEVTAHELELMLQSLDHCLATCHQKEHDTRTPCPDCAAARALKQRLLAATKG